VSVLGAIFGYSALRDEVDRLARHQKALQLEWDDFYDKAAKILRRMGRERVKLDEGENATQPEAPPDLPSSPQGTPHGFLSDRQRAIQQQILRRRAGLQ
jgi:hypothetical protein